jgi:putative ABC transport system permease protein
VKLVNVAALYGMRLRAQFGQELLALVGIAVGVSLLFAALVANTSLTASFERVTSGIVGDARFQLAARGGATMDDRLAEIRRLPGVAAAAAVLEVRGEVRGPGGRRSIVLFGVTPEFADLNGSLTRGFNYGFIEDVRAMAVPTPLADHLGVELGQLVDLRIGGRSVSARLLAKLQEGDTGGLYDSPIAIAPLRYLQLLSSARDQVTRIFVRPLPGREDEVERELRTIAAGRADVLPADFDGELFRQASQPTNQSTALFSIFSAMVGFLFAFSAVLLTVPQRRRLIADLRIEGYGPGTTTKVLLFDALVLGVCASLVGILLGDQLARQLFDQKPTFLEMAFPFGSERIVTVASVATAAVGGIVASLAAVLGPMSGELLRGRGEEAGAAERALPESWPVTAGFALLVLSGLVVVVSPRSTALGIGGLALLTLAMLALLPMLLRGIVRLLDLATSGVRSIVPFLAIMDLRDPATRLRSLAVAATGAVAVLGSVALQGAHADLQRGLDRTTRDLASMGDVWAVAPGRANLLATASFPQPPLARADGAIERVEAYRGTFLDVGDRRVWVVGAPASARRPVPHGQMVDGDTDRATRLLRAGGWAIVSSALARQQALQIGDRFVLPAPQPIVLRISALSTNLGWPPGAIVINADDYARAWGTDDVSALHATLAPGATLAEGRQALRRALGPHVGLDVQTSAQRERDQRAASREGLTRLTQIALLVLVSAMIAMAAAMAGMIWQRRAFLAAMKVEGYSTAELWRSLLLEAGVLIGAGCAIGAAFGLLGQSLLTRALTEITGFPVVYSAALLGAVLSVLAVTVVALAIVAAFGHRAARIAPEVGLR